MVAVINLSAFETASDLAKIFPETADKTCKRSKRPVMKTRETLAICQYVTSSFLK